MSVVFLLGPALVMRSPKRKGEDVAYVRFYFIQKMVLYHVQLIHLERLKNFPKIKSVIAIAILQMVSETASIAINQKNIV